MAQRPVHEAHYQRIKERILFGEVAPGQPLTIQGLAGVTGAGITPVREAIRRLISEGAIVSLENRRHAVPKMTSERLDQLQLLRMAIEPELAEMGAKNVGKSEIAKLERIDCEVNDAINSGNVGSYLEANYRFHFTLYRAAKAEVLLRHVEMIWLQLGPALRVACGRFGTSNLQDQHRSATDALKSGDVVAVRDAIKEDIRQGMKLVSI